MNDAQITETPPSLRSRPRSSWLVPAGLILLSLIPVLAGAARLGELAGGAVPTVHNARFLDSPVPVLAHIVGATIFSLIGAFQFVPALRHGRAGWHRVAGRILLLPAGLLAALSGMWMAAFYQRPPGDGLVMSLLRLFFGAAMVASLALGIRTISRRNLVGHGSWMTRAYALGVAAGTQALLLIPGAMLFGPADEPSRTVIMGVAWLLNLAVAEGIIRCRARQRSRQPALQRTVR